MKRKVLFITILVMTICISAINTSTDAGIKSFSTNYSYYEVKPGQTFTLKINGAKLKDVKWSSSQSSCVKVNKNSKFKALKVGSARLTGKYKSIKYTIDVNVCNLPMASASLRKSYDKSQESLEWYKDWYNKNLSKALGYDEFESKVKELSSENLKLKSEVQTLKDSLPKVVEKKNVNQLLFANTYLAVYFDRIENGEICLKFICKNTDSIYPHLDYVKINGATYYKISSTGTNIFKGADYDYTLKVQDNNYNSIDYNFSSGTFSGKGHYTDKNYNTVYFDFDTTIE